MDVNIIMSPGIIHRSATITLDSQAYDAYEVSLAQSVDAGNAFPAPTRIDAPIPLGFCLYCLSLDEGLPGESNSEVIEHGLNITIWCQWQILLLMAVQIVL